MQALFVHGMGRSPISGWPLLWQLKRSGFSTTSYGYSTAFENFTDIKNRLVCRICALADRGDYVLIGHSLGGVLLRAAMASLPAGTRQPHHLFLLASPVRPSRLAQKLGSNVIFRAATGDCGRLLGNSSSMAAIAPISVPTTAIVGIRGLPWRPDPFEGEPNDGVVSLSEVGADWLVDQVQIPTVHTLLPSTKRVAEIILARLNRDGSRRDS
jgi:pimeloyl-ACP methyl ester carboxylesterase